MDTQSIHSTRSKLINLRHRKHYQPFSIPFYPHPPQVNASLYFIQMNASSIKSLSSAHHSNAIPQPLSNHIWPPNGT